MTGSPRLVAADPVSDAPARRFPVGSLAYAALVAVAVFLAATTPFSGYVLNILMQAATYAIAVIEQRDEVVKMFPPRPPITVTLEAKLSMENVYSSCFMLPQPLAEQIVGIQPDAVVAAAVGEYAALRGKGFVRVMESGGEAILSLKARPGISCVTQQSRDNVSMIIDASVARTADQSTLVEKSFGGGLTGLRARMVSGPNQYAALISEWAKIHAPQIYWAAVEAWLRAR